MRWRRRSARPVRVAEPAPADDPDRGDTSLRRRLRAGYDDVSAAAQQRLGTAKAGLGARLVAMGDEARDRLEQVRGRAPVVDLGLRLWDRDREIGGSLLAAAVAFRLFLFQLPLYLLVIGGFGVAVSIDEDAAGQAAERAGFSDSVAQSISEAMAEAGAGRWAAVALGVFGVAWTGRGLLSSMIEVHARAWGVSRRQRAGTVRIAGALLGVLVAGVVVSTVAAQVRSAVGLPLTLSGFLVGALVYSVLFVLLSRALPRGSDSWLALVPGSVLLGLAVAGMQAFSQWYLAARISSASAIYGFAGAVAALLAWLFIAGRLLLGAAELNAVLWERDHGPLRFLARLARLRPTDAPDPGSPS